jgi:hypothetical protein
MRAHLDFAEEETYQSASSLVDKEYLANNIRAHSISRPTPNAHENSSGNQTVKACSKTSPHTGEYEEQQAPQDDRATAKRVRQRHPPQI